ncbi:MAG: HEPN domain-containing protein [Nostoc sp.]|uniref:HEPN domain-containing protein n=1 Tax=Nostoc sp. TaxID=1180 RepID=UPI002FFAA6E7
MGTDQISIEDVASLAEAPLIVPQEELGQGCIRYFGMKDLLNFVQCFPNFQRMLQTPHWYEKWIVLLEWYFQAIPRASGRRRNVLLPVVANALGTLLENLARIILVEEGTFSNNQFNELSLKGRINELLNRLGISGDNSVVDHFVTIRNNSTHAKSTSMSLTEMQQWEIVQKAVQWVDEVVLWRLGYGGQYRERNLQSIQSIQPRYDLSQRDPNW